MSGGLPNAIHHHAPSFLFSESGEPIMPQGLTPDFAGPSNLPVKIEAMSPEPPRFCTGSDIGEPAPLTMSGSLDMLEGAHSLDDQPQVSEDSPALVETAPEVVMAKRKRGRPRKDESAKGKAPVISEEPKRKRGRPSKISKEAQGEPSSTEAYLAQPVTLHQYDEGYWEMRGRCALLDDRVATLEEKMSEAKIEIAAHEKMFEKLRDLFCDRVDRELKEVVEFLEEASEFKRSAPPS